MEIRLTRLTGEMLLVTLFLLVSTACSRSSIPAPEANRERIGVYDSRAVAIAFVESEPFNVLLSEFQREHDNAVAAGDQKRVEELEANVREHQKRRHLQAFSTASVDDLLEYVANDLPELREKTGVEVLLSKWDENALMEYPSAERVDVTSDLIDLFNPSERQRRSAVQIQEHQPLSLDEARTIH